MKLFLLQHGDALAREADPRRPLSGSGRRDIERLGTFLCGSTILDVKQVYHSDKLRARETALCLAGICGDPLPVAEYAGLAALDSAAALAGEIANWTDNILIVSHVPLLPKLVSRLICEADEPEIVRFQPGTLVCLERNDRRRWAITSMIRPDMLTGADRY